MNLRCNVDCPYVVKSIDCYKCTKFNKKLKIEKIYLVDYDKYLIDTEEYLKVCKGCEDYIKTKLK